MKRIYTIILITGLLAIAGSLGITLGGRALQSAGGSSMISASQLIQGANASLIGPLAASGNALPNSTPAASAQGVAQASATPEPVPTPEITTQSIPASAPVTEPNSITTAGASQPAQPATLDSTQNPVSSTPVAVSTADASNNGGATTFKTKAYDQILKGLANLMNNVWGAPAGEAYNSGIYQSPDNSFGWFWTRQSPIIKTGQTAVTPIYPSLRIGGNCFDRSVSAYFPIKLADTKSLVLNVAYDYPQLPSGSYDLAYDWFLSDPSQPVTNPKIAAEVMVWIDSTAKQPAKYYQGDFTDGKNTFALYSWTMADGRAYYSFVLKSTPGSKGQFQIDAKNLMSQIKLDSNWLIHGIEFGTEVYNGSGQIHITQFGINLNGNQIIK